MEEMMNKLFELVNQTLERQSKLEESFNLMLGSINDAKSEFDTDQRRIGFRERNSEALSKFNDKLKAIEGDDFDVVDNAFAEYDKLEEKPDEAEYVAALSAKIAEQLKKIAAAYGVEEVEAKLESDGDMTIQADKDGDGVAEGSEEAVKVENVDEDDKSENNSETTEENKDDLLVEEDEGEVDSEEEIAADLKELEEEMKKYK